MKKHSDTPVLVIETDTIELLKKTYNKFQKIQIICSLCGFNEVYNLGNIKAIPQFCKKCGKSQRLIQRYGSLEKANEALLEKRKASNKLKFGVEFPLQSDLCKEKAKISCREHLGVDYALQSEEIREKGISTMLEKYGVDNAGKLRKPLLVDTSNIAPTKDFFFKDEKAVSLSDLKDVVGIYKITNLVTGDFYIGSSINIENRWKSHRNSAYWSKLDCMLYRDMSKYGLDFFKFEVIETCCKEALLEREQFYLKVLKPSYNSKLAISNRPKKESISGVYCIYNNITKQCYIGSSKNIKARWAQHKSPSTWLKQDTNQLYKDFKNYGLENFTFSILEECSIEQLKEREQFYIDNLSPYYNVGIAHSNVIAEDYFRSYRKQHKTKLNNYKNNYYNRLCIYNGEEIPFRKLARLFEKSGVNKPYSVAKKYLKDK